MAAVCLGRVNWMQIFGQKKKEKVEGKNSLKQKRIEKYTMIKKDEKVHREKSGSQEERIDS